MFNHSDPVIADNEADGTVTQHGKRTTVTVEAGDELPVVLQR